MANLLSAIDEEIAELKAALAGDPRQKKLAALEELRRLYTATPTSENVSEAARSWPPAMRQALSEGESSAMRMNPPVRVRRRVDPRRETLLKAVTNILHAVGPEPLKTADIFDVLSNEQRASIGGQDPRNNLSAILHNSGRFQSHGRMGWSLKIEEGGSGHPEEGQV